MTVTVILRVHAYETRGSFIELIIRRPPPIAFSFGRGTTTTMRDNRHMDMIFSNVISAMLL